MNKAIRKATIPAIKHSTKNPNNDALNFSRQSSLNESQSPLPKKYEPTIIIAIIKILKNVAILFFFKSENNKPKLTFHSNLFSIHIRHPAQPKKYPYLYYCELNLIECDY